MIFSWFLECPPPPPLKKVLSLLTETYKWLNCVLLGFVCLFLTAEESHEAPELRVAAPFFHPDTFLVVAIALARTESRTGLETAQVNCCRILGVFIVIRQGV